MSMHNLLTTNLSGYRYIHSKVVDRIAADVVAVVDRDRHIRPSAGYRYRELGTAGSAAAAYHQSVVLE